MPSILADGWKADAFWLEGLPVFADDGAVLPASADVVIIGAGYTGLNAALELVRGGRSTLVLDAEVPGWGCSTRNGGQISTSIKPSLKKLTRKYGHSKAKAIRDIGKHALDWIEQRIASEQIDCNFQRCGRFHGAHTPKHFDALAQEAQQLRQHEGIDAEIIPRHQQHHELGTDAYFGGVVFPHHASLDPAKYHQGLLRAAVAAGVLIKGHCPATKITKTASGFAVQTPKATIAAKEVIVATNGYTGTITPWLKRRVIPIGSYIIATEPLPRALMDRLFPKDRIISDTRKVVYYFRPSPDRKRVLFGGRVSANETDPAISAPRLFADMCRMFPDLHAYQITHSWMGKVAYSFDELPHIGTHNGIHYAMGYCGSGISSASYLGMRIGQKILGQDRAALDGLTFPTRPLYSGKPWFLPPLVAFYRWRDRAQCQRAMRSK